MQSADMSFTEKVQECKCGLPRGAHLDDGPIAVDHLSIDCKGFDPAPLAAPEVTSEVAPAPAPKAKKKKR